MNIWRQPIDGSAATQLTEFKSGKIMNFAWTADGKELIIARGNTNNDLILIKDSDRAAQTQTVTSVANRKRSIFDSIFQIFSSVR